MNIGFRMLGALLLSLLASSAVAHPGTHELLGVSDGLAHPFMGWDHALAAIAAGLWAVQRGGRALWITPLAYLSALSVAAYAAPFGFNIPFIESGIAVSIAAIGLLLFAAARIPFALGLTAIGVFALWHGYVHGAEIAATTQNIGGLILGTGFLHAAGLLLGYRLQQRRTLWLRNAGVGLAASGCLMLAGI